MAKTVASAIPHEAAVAFNTANAAYRAGKLTEARTAIEHAVAAAPDLPQVHVLNARILRQLGDDVAARSAYDAALARDPAQFDALLERGNVLRALSVLSEAASSYVAAMAARPDDPRPALALARLEEERIASEGIPAAERAVIAFQRALDRASRGADPAIARAGLCRDLARYRMDRSDLPRALEALRQARLYLGAERHNDPAPEPATEPAPEPTTELDLMTAEVLLRLGMLSEAQRAMERLSQSADVSVLRALSHLAYRFNFWAEAVTILGRATALTPTDPHLWLELSDMQAKSWLLQEALASLDRAEQAGPVPEAATLALRASIANRIGDSAASLALYDRLVSDGHAIFAPSAAMSLLYADHLTPEQVAKRHFALFADRGDGARSPASFGVDRNSERPLRIGMVTADLHHQHPVNIFLQPLLARWNHETFPLTIYFTGTTTDDQTRLARARAGNWCETTEADLPGRVAADSIDILIDLSGHTAGSTLRQFARRMAPVQASFLGYPGTTGVPNIDWLIGDPVVTPPEADHLCSEQVARLPHTVFCFAPEVDYPLPDFAAALDRPFTFGSFNNVPKLTPRTLRLWARVLSAVPQARLVLRAPSFSDAAAVDHIRKRFTAAGGDPDRLDFRGPVALDQMMQSYAEVDVALDPLPYGGGTTTLQAMWMGVPVITLAGGSFVARMGASFLTAARMTDWIAESEDAYIARAVAAASDRPALIELKSTLRERLVTLPAWDPDRYAADFGATLHRMWYGPRPRNQN